MDNIDELLKNFDILFNTNKFINFNKANFPLLLKIFEKFREDLNTSTQEYMHLKNTKQAIFENLQKSLTEKQKKLFEEYWEIENKMKNMSEEEIFLFGYFINNELEKENALTK